MSKAIELIAVERRRQVESEGYDAEHDEAHDAGELLYMGALPLLKAITGAGPIAYDPWGLAKKHAHDRLRALTIAGALIAAQLDLELGEQPACAPSHLTENREEMARRLENAVAGFAGYSVTHHHIGSELMAVARETAAALSRTQEGEPLGYVVRWVGQGEAGVMSGFETPEDAKAQAETSNRVSVGSGIVSVMTFAVVLTKRPEAPALTGGEEVWTHLSSEPDPDRPNCWLHTFRCSVAGRPSPTLTVNYRTP